MTIDELPEEIHPDIRAQFAELSKRMDDAERKAGDANALAKEAAHYAYQIERLIRPQSPQTGRKARSIASVVSLAAIAVGCWLLSPAYAFVVPGGIVLSWTMIGAWLQIQRQTRGTRND